MFLLTCTYGRRRDVGEISSNTGSVDNIVEGQFGDERRDLEEQRERLADSSRGTSDN